MEPVGATLTAVDSLPVEIEPAHGMRQVIGDIRLAIEHRDVFGLNEEAERIDRGRIGKAHSAGDVSSHLKQDALGRRHTPVDAVMKMSLVAGSMPAPWAGPVTGGSCARVRSKPRGSVLRTAPLASMITS